MAHATPTFRRLSDGTLSRAEAEALAATLRIDPLANVVTGMLDEIGDYDGDFLVHDGPLQIEGDFDVSKIGAVVLFVLGGLTVSGCYSDSDDPQTITQVTGTLRARDVVTAGFLEVHGDAIAERAFFGDYNDCNGYVGGALRCAVFFPENHSFTVVGDLHADLALGHVKHRVDGQGARPEAIDLSDPRLLEHFDRSLLLVEEGDEDELIVDGFDDYGAVRQRAFRGEPFKTPDSSE